FLRKLSRTRPCRTRAGGNPRPAGSSSGQFHRVDRLAERLASLLEPRVVRVLEGLRPLAEVSGAVAVPAVGLVVLSRAGASALGALGALLVVVGLVVLGRFVAVRLPALQLVACAADRVGPLLEVEVDLVHLV